MWSRDQVQAFIWGVCVCVCVRAHWPVSVQMTDVCMFVFVHLSGFVHLGECELCVFVCTCVYR